MQDNTTAGSVSANVGCALDDACSRGAVASRIRSSRPAASTSPYHDMYSQSSTCSTAQCFLAYPRKSDVPVAHLQCLDAYG
ncbi:hypothetical protein MRB53_041796 [Persea americana]|nr:hypothetical protein MRB53_041796 [Persea americana]